MSAISGLNGIPSAAHKELLTNVLRSEWYDAPLPTQPLHPERASERERACNVPLNPWAVSCWKALVRAMLRAQVHRLPCGCVSVDWLLCDCVLYVGVGVQGVQRLRHLRLRHHRCTPLCIAVPHVLATFSG